MSIPGQIKKAMNEAEVSQAELSARAGLAKSSISQYLSGKNKPTKKALEKIAEALGCSEEFLCYEPIEPVKPDNTMKQNLSVEEAARRLDKSQQFVRVGLQTERLHIGTAVKMPGGQWSYHISAKLLDEYIGKEDVE